MIFGSSLSSMQSCWSSYYAKLLTHYEVDSYVRNGTG